jgi:large subunit ribosomal protein L1
MFSNFYRTTTLFYRLSHEIQRCGMTTAVQNNVISPRRIIVRENKRKPPKTSTAQPNQSTGSPSMGAPLSLPMEEALRVLRAYSLERFDETVDVAILFRSLLLGKKKSSSSPLKTFESLRGFVEFPHGTGKSVKTLVFATGLTATSCKQSGATYVGGAELLPSITSGELKFDRCLCTPDMVPVVSKIASYLGPRGLMPNTKHGTITTSPEDLVRRGSKMAEFLCDNLGWLRLRIGKLSFTDSQLGDNLKALNQSICLMAKREERHCKYTFIIKHVLFPRFQSIGIPQLTHDFEAMLTDVCISFPCLSSNSAYLL